MKIKASVLSILFPRDVVHTPGTPQWYVLMTTAGKIVGSSRMPIIANHTYNFEGGYSVYHGENNYKFVNVCEDIPDDPKALLEYACLTTKGLGPKFAEKIWNKYGADWETEISPSQGAKEYDLYDTMTVLHADSSRAKEISQLIRLGLTQGLAEKAYTAFGGGCLKLVQTNPYVLAKLPQCSFQTVDGQYRERFGIPLESELRAEALLDYTINHVADQTGDTALDRDMILAEASKLQVPYDVLLKVIEQDGNNRWVSIGSKITSELMYAHEAVIAGYISETSRDNTEYPSNIVASDDGIVLDESQQAAVKHAMSHAGLSVINGGAGTGKTTIIKALANSLEANGEMVNLCAFAGKAAARIREATGHDATTIHAMLMYMPEIGFNLTDLHGITVIVDEASMVPASLMYEICKREPKRLVLVGDEGQLPPVGAGAPFHDAVAMGFASTITTCYRNKEAVFEAAQQVRFGKVPERATTDNERFEIVRVRNADEAHKYIESILPYMDFDKDIIIAPKNGGGDWMPATVATLNYSAMQHLQVKDLGESGCRIICLKNEPRLSVWNGTTAVVDTVDIDGSMYCTTDDGVDAKLTKKYVKESIAPAYALTIHKSQGSQYRNVVVVCLFRDTISLLDRQMLYTAITRAKASCLIVTDCDLGTITAKTHRRETILSVLLCERKD